MLMGGLGKITNTFHIYSPGLAATVDNLTLRLQGVLISDSKKDVLVNI